MRIVFMGTADFAKVSLESLASTPGFDLAAVVTQPDRPRGRELKPHPSSVKQAALARGLPIFQPAKIRDSAFIDTLGRLSPDLIVVAAYGQILPPSILGLPPSGCLNVHASLLPKYRGAAPIQWAILEDEPLTGVTIMKMDAGLDTGAILAQNSTPIQPEDDAQTLHHRLAALGAALLVETIPGYLEGRLPCRPQPPLGATLARKIAKEDGLLEWGRPARALWNQTRAFIPWPGSFTWLAGGPRPRLLKIWKAREIPNPPSLPGSILRAAPDGILVACGQNALQIQELQVEGSKRLSTAEFLAGHPLPAGSMLG
jgi:methionyl-tRNA formyltransferase